MDAMKGSKCGGGKVPLIVMMVDLFDSLRSPFSRLVQRISDGIDRIHPRDAALSLMAGATPLHPVPPRLCD